MSSQGNNINLLKQLPFYGRAIEPRIKEFTNAKLLSELPAVCFGATWRENLLIPFFKLKKHFSQVSILKITYSHMHILFALLIKKTPLKSVYKEPTYIFFYDTPKSEFF